MATGRGHAVPQAPAQRHAAARRHRPGDRGHQRARVQRRLAGQAGAHRRAVEPGDRPWTTLAAEDVDRCYHATAVLLPDGTVLSAGGGEFMVGAAPNAPADTHRDAQVFHPPYLFRGTRPAIVSAPVELTLGGTFAVEVADPDVARMTLVRLASVTHAFDENQRFVPVPFTAQGTTLQATLPAAARRLRAGALHALRAERGRGAVGRARRPDRRGGPARRAHGRRSAGRRERAGRTRAPGPRPPGWPTGRPRAPG